MEIPNDLSNINSINQGQADRGYCTGRAQRTGFPEIGTKPYTKYLQFV